MAHRTHDPLLPASAAPAQRGSIRARLRTWMHAGAVSLLVAVCCVGVAAPALAHGPSAADATSTAERKHADEHAATAAAIKRFDRLSAKRKRAIRKRLLGTGGGPNSRVATRSLIDGDPALVGRWTTGPFATPDYAVHAVLLPHGRVLLFSMGSGHGTGPGATGNGGQGLENDGQATIWDPSKGYGPASFTSIDPPPVSLDDPYQRPGYTTPRAAPLFCAGQVQLADGRVLIAGGNLEASNSASGLNGGGLKLLFLFDPETDTWVREPDMKRARWYPTLTRLANGQVSIIGGQDESRIAVNSTELYPAAGLPVPGLDGVGSLIGLPTSEPAARWEAGMYPHAMVLPSGRLASSTWGAGPMWLWEPTTGRAVQRTSTYLSMAGSYATAFPVPGDQAGTSEMIEVGGTVRSTLGLTQLTGNAFRIAPEQETAWRTSPALNVPRRNATAIVLPDGSAAAFSGGLEDLRFPLFSGALPSNLEQKRVELWNPASGTWTLGPAQAIPRGYHSVALLLPDGRVLSGGDDFVSTILDTNRGDTIDSTMELYSPPYLFRGARPVLEAAPASVGYGETIEVRATAERPVVRATLMAPGSATHAIDMNQRLLELPIRNNGDDTYSITGPLTSGAAPPGDYMLFVLNDLGVPSIAEWIKVRPRFPGQGAPTLTPLPGDTAKPPNTVTREDVIASLKTFFKTSSANAKTGLQAAGKRCRTPKKSRSAKVNAQRAEQLRACRAKIAAAAAAAAATAPKPASGIKK